MGRQNHARNPVHLITVKATCHSCGITMSMTTQCARRRTAEKTISRLISHHLDCLGHMISPVEVREHSINTRRTATL